MLYFALFGSESIISDCIIVLNILHLLWFGIFRWASFILGRSLALTFHLFLGDFAVLYIV